MKIQFIHTFRASVAAALCGLMATVSVAQTDRSLWNCAETRCTEIAAYDFATLSGTFLYGHDLNTKTEVDRVAALEQQSLREFEFMVNENAMIFAQIRADPDYRPTDWTGPVGKAEALMWLSADGETYTRIEGGAAVKAGDLLLVAVRQERAHPTTDSVTYLPARWTVTLSQTRLQAVTDLQGTKEEPSPPTAISADDDPAPDPVPPEQTDDVSVLGNADPGNPATAGAVAAPASPGADELAAELQRELARVGCYTAAIDGLWGPASRRALQDFDTLVAGAPVGTEVTARALVRVSQATAPVCTGG